MGDRLRGHTAFVNGDYVLGSSLDFLDATFERRQLGELHGKQRIADTQIAQARPVSRRVSGVASPSAAAGALSHPIARSRSSNT
jgi:hypothetical protein